MTRIFRAQADRWQRLESPKSGLSQLRALHPTHTPHHSQKPDGLGDSAFRSSNPFYALEMEVTHEHAVKVTVTLRLLLECCYNS